MHAGFKPGQIQFVSLSANTNFPGPNTFFRPMSQPDFQLVMMSSCQIFTQRFISFNHFSPSWGISTLPQLTSIHIRESAGDFGRPLLNIVGCIGTKKGPFNSIKLSEHAPKWRIPCLQDGLIQCPYQSRILPLANQTTPTPKPKHLVNLVSIPIAWINLGERNDISPTTNFLSKENGSICLLYFPTALVV